MLVDANGTKLNYEISGKSGAPWVTFSNSLATDIHMWDEVAAAIGRDFRVLRYDKRGHGNSPPVKGPYSFDLLVGDIIGLWNALDVEKSHFVGLSIGGMTAQGLALAHPGRVLSITIANSAAQGSPEFKAAWEQRIGLAEKEGMGALVEPTVQRWCSPSFYAANPPMLEKMRGMVRNTSVMGYVGCGRALQGLNYLDRLSQIRQPTLLIAGKEDVATPPAGMKAIGERIKGSKYIELSPAGHVSAMEQPAAFAKALREFLPA